MSCTKREDKSCKNREDKSCGTVQTIVCKKEGRKEGRKEGTCLFDINTKHNTEIYIGKIISGDSH